MTQLALRFAAAIDVRQQYHPFFRTATSSICILTTKPRSNEISPTGSSTPLYLSLDKDEQIHGGHRSLGGQYAIFMESN